MATRSKTANRSASTFRTASSNDLPEVAAKAGTALKAAAEASAAFTPAAVVAPNSPDFVSELNNIDFQKMIGGPLQAVVNAQVASALATVDFINNVGFRTVTDENGKQQKELVMVDFSHSRKDVKEDGSEQSKSVAVRVPLLAMLPIPSLRIDHATIDFNVKLNSVASASVSSSLGIDGNIGGKIGPVEFKVSASYQRKTSSNIEVKKEYALAVSVKVTQDEIPPGLEKLLNLLAA